MKDERYCSSVMVDKYLWVREDFYCGNGERKDEVEE